MADTADTADTDEYTWENGLKYVTDGVLKQLFDVDKALSYNEGFNRTRVEQSVLKILTHLVPPFADVRQKKLESDLENAQHAITKAEGKLEMESRRAARLEETVEQQKKILKDTEARYEHQLAEMRRVHQQKLVEVDAELAAQQPTIDDLRSEVASLKRDQTSKVPGDESKDYYIKNLESEFGKLKTRNGTLQAQLNSANASVAERDSELVLERASLENILQQSDTCKEDLKGAQNAARQLVGRVQILEGDRLALEKRTRELQATVDDKEAELERLRDRGSPSSKRSASMKTSSSSSIKGGMLGSELDAADHIEALENQIADYKEQIKELQKTKSAADDKIKALEKGGKSGGDLDKCKKERDDLQGQLKKANAKNDENNKEIKRLRPFEPRAEALEKRERELQSQLKARASELKRAEDELKRLKQSGGDNKGAKEGESKGDAEAAANADALKAKEAELKATVDRCKKEKTALNDRIAQLNRELEQARKDRDSDDDADKTPVDDRIKALKAELEKVRADYEAKLAAANKSRDELADYFTGLYQDLFDRTREVQANMEAQAKINQATHDQYVERLRQMNEDIGKHPSSAESALNRRRAVGLEKEIERMNGIIQTLTQEGEWFRDVINSFKEGKTKAEQAGVPPPEGVPGPGPGHHGQGQGQGQGQQDGGMWNIVAGVNWGAWADDPRNIATIANLAGLAVMTATVIATGREYGAYMHANSGVKRGLFISTLEKGAICFRMPTWELFWEFIVAAFAGRWVWKA
ncbi:hypothetical protein F4677DRAFT_442743 [Hypoxylon crocopeplum]|nr:hypothetical protein F4677DRAFT_442743 [Hypoxylon crocopeplum]